MFENYLGDIYIITGIDYDLVSYLKTHDIIDSDNLIACKYELAKRDAEVKKVNHNGYIDIEEQNNNLNSDSLLKTEVYDPYIGQLFIKNIRKVDIKTLKYINTQVNN